MVFFKGFFGKLFWWIILRFNFLVFFNGVEFFFIFLVLLVWVFMLFNRYRVFLCWFVILILFILFMVIMVFIISWNCFLKMWLIIDKVFFLFCKFWLNRINITIVYFLCVNLVGRYFFGVLLGLVMWMEIINFRSVFFILFNGGEKWVIFLLFWICNWGNNGKWWWIWCIFLMLFFFRCW